MAKVFRNFQEVLQVNEESTNFKGNLVDEADKSFQVYIKGHIVHF